MTELTISNSMDMEFFVGNGEMAALMRSLDWSKTLIGLPQTWPQSLRTTVRIMLTSRFAMWMAWGQDLTFLYNDDYLPTLGVKHPWALGKPARNVWAEIWPAIGPRIEKVLNTGAATWDEGLLLFLERSGYTEETYHTFSYSPLSDDTGVISGMLCVVTEETQRVIGERRLKFLREVAAALASAQTRDEVFAAIASCFEANPRDLPFTLTYLFESEGNTARLVNVTGMTTEHPLAMPIIGQENADTPWPLHSLLTNPAPVQIDNLSALFEALPTGLWDKSPQQAVVVPIVKQRQGRPAGFMVIALNPYRKLDAEYMGFVNLLVGQIAASLANAQAYEEEKQRAEALAELDRAKTTFFSNVSHEFRTPLTLMLGPMEEALRREGKALSGENLEVVHRNSLRLLKLVNTLLDFSRIEAGRMQAVYEPTDLAAYTAELASVFRSAIEKAGMQFLVNCPPMPAMVYIDRDMWEKIVLNLLSNAFKFTEKGEIEVALRAEEGQAVLIIRDTGTGIAEEQLSHIFERFHRVEGVRARTHEGTGIGLALVAELVKLHGGDIAVESAVGKGTAFIISIPQGTAHLPQDRIQEKRAINSATHRANPYIEEALRWLPDPEHPVLETSIVSGYDVQTEEKDREKDGDVPSPENTLARIVLADDNTDMREYIARLLSELYEVEAVADGEAALQTIQARPPDLVLSDVMMPRLDGFGLLQSLREDPVFRTIPVILLSARAGEEAHIEGLSSGADDYLIKPFSARELLARVASHLKLARIRREAEQTIRESEERFRVALSNVPLTVFNCDRELRYTWLANPVEGTAVEEILGKRDDEILPHDEVSEFIAFKERVLATGQGARQEIPYNSPTGTKYYDITAEPLRNQEGEIIGLTAAAFDITPLKQYERNLAAMNVRLQRAMTETHHRVKNNLQLISALIDMQRDRSDELVPISEFARLSANVRALSVIHDILTQEAKAGSEQETLSAKAVLERLLNVLELTIGNRKLVSVLEDTRLAGRQATTLALVTNELISNALKHGKGQTNIDFRVNCNLATLEVCDDGPGFPEDFDVETAANTGLELVENIVKWDLNGQSAYENRPEGGARITVTFPIAGTSP